jgi:FkbM family methyltransferase
MSTDTGTRTHAGYHSKVVFDIGLHKGEDTSFYLRKGYKVIAFEADPDLVQLCKNRFKSQIATQQLHIVEGAVTSEIGAAPIRFYKNAKLSVWGTIRQDWNERNESVGAGGMVIEVARVDMGLCIEKFGIPHFMKIDIEGADTIALNALREFNQRPAYISIESSKVGIAEVQNELNLLRDLGYHEFMPVQQSNIPGTQITTTDLEGEPFTFVFEKDASGPFGDDLPKQWLGAEECMARYRDIFKLYRLFGDKSLFRKIPGGLKFRKGLEKVCGRPLPGWYDTHAALRK